MTSWEDRRGLFQKGKEKQAPPTELGRQFGERRTSGSGIADAVRRASVSSSDGLDKTLSSTSSGGQSPTGQRRRSSNTGLFGNLQQHKRGSEDYGERRTSHHEQAPAGGFVSGWFNSTFKGHQRPAGSGSPPAAAAQQSQTEQQKRGVME